MSNSYRTYSYTYGNSDFGDQLTAYDGVTITYDALGNPLSYYNGSSYTFTWTGRQLATAAKGSGSTISYEYNASGMRTSKTASGAKTLYFYDGDRLVGEMNGTNITVYLYSPDGGIAGMQVRSLSSSSSTWTPYWYEKNLQGDIVAIYNNAGTKLASYTYDAWGSHVVNYTNGGGSITAIVNNPFRYRSYYYDTDLNLYYLGSRYYDPAICRFINMDAIGVINATPMALTDKNLYAYCDNNPVMRVDEDGEFWLTALIGGAIGAIVGGASAALSGGDAFDIFIGVASGFAGGALTASGVGVVGQMLGSSVISMSANAISQFKNIITKKTNSFDYIDVLFDGATSAITAAWGGNGAIYGNSAGIVSAWNRYKAKGLLNKRAAYYFAKTAHNSDNEFVFTSIVKSSGKNAFGSAIVFGKNLARSIFR